MKEQPSTSNVEHAFDPELRQAQQDWDLYLRIRPALKISAMFCWKKCQSMRPATPALAQTVTVDIMTSKARISGIV